jgi:hypothetical protein
MTLVISKGITLRKGWQPMDADAAAYIAAVETADTEPLEERTKIAIDNFVLGCKADGIWTAIKASCILAGARTRLGALTPLVGAAPTSFNFVDGDYNRKTGLVGDGSTKYLDSNRNNNADPQNSKHVSVYCTTASTVYNFSRYIVAGDSTQGDTGVVTSSTGPTGNLNVNLNNSVGVNSEVSQTTTGLLALNRSVSGSFSWRLGGITGSSNKGSTTPRSENIALYGRPQETSPTRYVNARLAFYSIGESLNLALLDARVTDLINAFAAAIP